MSTIKEWQQIIGQYADDKGWWTPQCKHRPFGPNTPEAITWCSDCGASRSDADSAWRLPKSASERNLGELHMLFVTEVAESYEEIRNGKPVNEVYFNGKDAYGLPTIHHDPDDGYVVDKKPEGVPSEIADVAIRLLDFCAHMGIDLEAEIERKHNYNLTRSYRHGNKLA